jgi:membrane-bound serine protease (ClpP class)
MNPFLLAFIGLLLILFEFYLPGAIMGILGSLLLIASVVLFALQTSSLLALSLFVIGVVITIILVIRFALWRIVHAKPDYSIYLHKDQEGYQASSFDKTLIGKTGVVLSDLKPGGYILVEGQQYQAISVSGYITKGNLVSIIGGQEESFIVQFIKKEGSHDNSFATGQ